MWRNDFAQDAPSPNRDSALRNTALKARIQGFGSGPVPPRQEGLSEKLLATLQKGFDAFDRMATREDTAFDECEAPVALVPINLTGSGAQAKVQSHRKEPRPAEPGIDWKLAVNTVCQGGNVSSFVHLATECGDEQEESLVGSVLAEELLRATKRDATIRILIVVRAVVAGGHLPCASCALRDACREKLQQLCKVPVFQRQSEEILEMFEALPQTKAPDSDGSDKMDDLLDFGDSVLAEADLLNLSERAVDEDRDRTAHVGAPSSVQPSRPAATRVDLLGIEHVAETTQDVVVDGFKHVAPSLTSQVQCGASALGDFQVVESATVTRYPILEDRKSEPPTDRKLTNDLLNLEPACEVVGEFTRKESIAFLPQPPKSRSPVMIVQR